MVFTVLTTIVLCPFSHVLVTRDTSLYVLVQDVRMCIPSTAHDTNPELTSRSRAVSLAGSERARGFDRSDDITAIDKLHSEQAKTSRGFTIQSTESIWAISGQNLDE
jgi:hypothetical protein